MQADSHAQLTQQQSSHKQALLKSHTELIKQLEQQHNSLTPQHDSSIQTVRAEHNSARDKYQAQHKSQTQTLMAQHGQVVQLQQQLADLQGCLHAEQSKTLKLEQQLQKASSARARLEAEVAGLQRSVASAEQDKADAKADLHRLTMELKEKRTGNQADAGSWANGESRPNDSRPLHLQRLGAGLQAAQKQVQYQSGPQPGPLRPTQQPMAQQQMQSSRLDKQSVKGDADGRSRQATGAEAAGLRIPEERAEARVCPEAIQPHIKDTPSIPGYTSGEQLKPAASQPRAVEVQEINPSSVQTTSSRPPGFVFQTGGALQSEQKERSVQKGGRYKAKRNSKSFQGTAVTTNPGVALQGPQGSADQRSMSPTDAATAGPYVDDDPVVATPVEASTTGSAASSPSDEDQQMSDYGKWVDSATDEWAFMQNRGSRGPISRAQLAFFLDTGLLQTFIMVHRMSQKATDSRTLAEYVEDWKAESMHYLGHDQLYPASWHKTKRSMRPAWERHPLLPQRWTQADMDRFGSMLRPLAPHEVADRNTIPVIVA